MNAPKKLAAFASALFFALAGTLPVLAEDYSDEDAWYAKCTQPQTSQEGVAACQGFQEYQAQKKAQLSQSIANFSESISGLELESTEVQALAQEQKTLADDLSNEIALKEEAIAQIETNIADLQGQIDAKQAEIDAWDAQIKERMRSEQGSLGTNMLVDLIFGSGSLNDMLRRITGLERITENDQDQIEQLNVLKDELELSKSELVRLQEDQQRQKDELEEQKAQAQALEDAYNQLVSQYEAQIAQLQAQIREAQADIESIRSFTISSAYSGTIASSSGFTVPVIGGTYSAGTWAYPGGGLHLGLDWAAPIGSTVVAPADGLILYANNPAPTNGGYLGNWAGYPYGGGNTIEMLCNINGTLYAISFAHLAQEGMSVSAGQSVAAGQAIALTGNSGNSTGPHCHIEVYNLGSMSVEEAVARFSASADFAWGTGWSGSSTACEVTGTTPCRERPEVFFS
jgi:murein DD-endopeptidase MepM/ murein hydrolase activator NlpD